jgi:hypothetical protein
VWLCQQTPQQQQQQRCLTVLLLLLWQLLVPDLTAGQLLLQHPNKLGLLQRGTPLVLLH